MTDHITVPVFVPHAGCPHDCSFCNQRTISGTPHPPTPQQAAAVFAKARESLGIKMYGAQLAFFGGSFTAIDEEYRTALLEAAQPFLGPQGFSGIRVSTRPDCVTPEILEQLERYNVTTIELGVQSMSNEVLRANRRGHTDTDVEKASALIRGRGFQLGLQMMTGLYADSDEGAVMTARRIIGLKPDMVRVYPTLVLKDTLLEQLYREGNYTPPTLEQTVNLGAQLLKLFAKAKIPVIRFGLQDEAEMDVVAGPHHPALRELCESRLLLDKAWHRIKRRGLPPGPLEMRVHPRCLSKMIGQHRQNIRFFNALGYDVKVFGDQRLPMLEVEIRSNKE